MILGIDPGGRRVGVALADASTRFARPLEVIDKSTTDEVARIAELVAEHEVTEVVVGRPVGLSGRSGPAVQEHEQFVLELRAGLGVPVSEFDERFTTVLAEQALRSGGASATARKEIRDAVAASVMLQDYVDAGMPRWR
jgi:putative holliday junction resolvase